MKVRLLTSIYGDTPAAGGEGEIVDVDPALGKVLCSEPADAPRAEPVGETRAAKRETRAVKVS